MMMKALVLAGGYPQIALIEELKKRGVFTVLADWYEAPVARKYADKFYQVSTLDVEAITEVARNEEVDFLITACTDQALLTVAQVSEILGLPCYIDYQTALNVTNKSYMKKVFVQNNIPTAKYYVMSEIDTSIFGNMKYPLIVKPVDCNSSKGVCKVYDAETLENAFANAVQLSRTNTAIVEEYVNGTELSVDAYVEEGVAHILSITNSEKIAADDKFVIFRAKYPAVADETIVLEIEKIAQKIADAFELKNTPMLIQLINDGKGVYVLEFSARTGGGVKYQLIKRISGFDVISAVVDLTLQKKPHVQIGLPESKYISNEFIYCYPGTFDHLEGFEELKRQGVITDYFLFKWQGAIFDGVENSGDRVGGFTIQADDMNELVQKHQKVAEKIKVIDIHGKDMMRHDLLTDIQL